MVMKKIIFSDGIFHTSEVDRNIFHISEGDKQKPSLLFPPSSAHNPSHCNKYLHDILSQVF